MTDVPFELKCFVAELDRIWNTSTYIYFIAILYEVSSNLIWKITRRIAW